MEHPDLDAALAGLGGRFVGGISRAPTEYSHAAREHFRQPSARGYLLLLVDLDIGYIRPDVFENFIFPFTRYRRMDANRPER